MKCWEDSCRPSTGGTTAFAADCSDYKSYAFKDTWGGDDADSVKKVYEFFQTKYFLTELAPVAGAFEGLNAIKKAVPNAVSTFGSCCFFSPRRVFQTARWCSAPLL